MFGIESLDPSSLALVKNIYKNFSTHPYYLGYQFEYYEESDCAVIEMSKNGKGVNMYRFYPKPYNGELGSIAIYGIGLEKHYNAINNSKNIFGFSVEEVEICNANTLDSFVDVTLV